MESTLSQLLPDALATRRRALAKMITGLHLAEHVHLSKVASRITGTAQLESKTRHLRRFLGNEEVDPERFYSPVRDRLIEWAAQGAETEGSGPIRLLVDTVELPGERQVLMAAIAYRRRALPICWETYRREGVTDAEKQISLLRALAGLFPDEAEVVVVGDGAFHSTDLMEFIEGQEWHFCLRLHADTYVRSSEEGSWKQLRDLVPEEGEDRYLQKVIVTKDNEYGPVNLALCHAEDEDDPWLICTDREADYAALRTYSRRMWIEQLFADLEDGGFHLNRSRIYPPERLSRLVMALSWTYVWLLHVGAWMVKRGFRSKVDRTSRRDRSYVELGRRWLQRCLTNQIPLRIGIRPYF
jgi:hypothetical protein